MRCKLLLKRLFDIILSLLLLVILLPILIVIALIARVKLGSPVFFKQARPGYKEKIFHMYKFRSMTDATDKEGNLLSDEERMTKFGLFLRKTSLDELPELWNILCGDMSFVGPRPLLVRYLNRYTPEQARRHDVKPGLTGWAQVNGRNAISWDEKFRFDVWYVDNWSLYLDFKILFMTAGKVLRREGISADGETTVSEFMGDKSE